MTYLELVQRAKIECGISGPTPTTVATLTGELLRLATWVSQSWVDVQAERQDWHFLRKNVTFNTVANQQTYQVGTGLDIDISDFKKWRKDSLKAYLQSSGVGTEIPLTEYHNYSEFRDYYLTGSRRLVTGRPLYYTVNPSDRAILLGFTPSDVYVCNIEYFRSAQRLTADADEPIIPEDYHMLIVYRTMKKYGMFEVANEQVTAGKEEYSQLYNRLVTDYTDEIVTGGSLI